MATQEKINKMVCTRLQEHKSKIGYNEGINIEYFATDCATEQDKIARQEERERACEWLSNHANDYYYSSSQADCCGYDDENLIADFRKAMMEE